jgi:two-component system KDP operon response regulator KdpE
MKPQIRKMLEITLQTNGYLSKSAVSAKEGLIMAANHPPELILLDLGLPDENGHMVLQKLRQWYTNPVIILSVQKNEEDIIKALDNGANDYLSKPFRTGELLARIRSALRDSISEEGDTTLNFNDLQIDLSTRMVKKNNQLVKLTSTEYNLLAILIKNEGKGINSSISFKSHLGAGVYQSIAILKSFYCTNKKKN